ncbi:hypothetical protein [Demequina sp. NBRC 110052]|uniref:hypothetical protein n=1 Tax=Demequina sp. NBRC 110052 TaxID=1570341 RepID=UPI0013564F61|nr:hypothetical protein [Demequina sp. NBRC 110052]
MTWEEIFVPGMQAMREQQARDRLTPPSLPAPADKTPNPPEGVVIPGLDELEPFADE